MIEDKSKIYDYICNMLEKENYILSSSTREYFALDSFVIQYVNCSGNRDNIKIEINYINRSHIFNFNKKILMY